MRGSFQFYGASRTGRWAGRLVQPHNLPRGSLRDGADIGTARDTVMDGDLDLMRLLFDDVSGALSSLVRSIIAAPPGLALVVADYSSIESVMLAWSCGSDYLLDLFRQGRTTGRKPVVLYRSGHTRRLARQAWRGCAAPW